MRVMVGFDGGLDKSYTMLLVFVQLGYYLYDSLSPHDSACIQQRLQICSYHCYNQ